jgi:GH15 family glucan-1,4-alpha-glucosidase
MRKAPEQRWRRARNDMREAIETKGYNERRGVFVQAFGEDDLDASLLFLPTAGFVDWNDERMVRTADAIREELGEDGLLRRYKNPDGVGGREGAFISCSFWLVECLARAGETERARELFERLLGFCNDVGLLSEEYDPSAGEMLGNFPQGLTHLSHIAAVVALTRNAPAVDQ